MCVAGETAIVAGVVRILLECILVCFFVFFLFFFFGRKINILWNCDPAR